MTTKYLLPCECGQKNEVLASQSGLTINCTCGRTLQVPTLKNLRQLEAVGEAAPEAPEQAWEPRHTVRFIGALLALLGIGWGLYIVLNPTVIQPEEDYEPEVVLEPLPDNIRPHEALIEFRNMQLPELPQEAKVARTQEEKIFSVICFVVGGLGVIMLATAGLFTPPPSRGPPA